MEEAGRGLLEGGWEEVGRRLGGGWEEAGRMQKGSKTIFQTLKAQILVGIGSRRGRKKSIFQTLKGQILVGIGSRRGQKMHFQTLQAQILDGIRSRRGRNTGSFVELATGGYVKNHHPANHPHPKIHQKAHTNQSQK